MTDLINSSMPRWVVMWLITVGIFFISKIIIIINARKKPIGWRLFAFLFLWVGMDEKEWVSSPNKINTTHHTLLNSVLKIMLGSILLWLVARQFTNPLLAGWCGMIGLIFILHFGLFDACTIFWRYAGIEVKPIMENPAKATSLTDFWGRRWNIAFRDLAHIFIFKPFVMRFGTKIALCLSFIFSGLLHELLISVPAGGGYGLATGYFLTQAIGILLERRLFKNIKSTEKLPIRWIFTHTFTILPAYFLFHPPFVKNVMIPFFHFIGALP